MGSKIYLSLAAIIILNIGCIYWLQHLISLQQNNQSSAKPLAKSLAGGTRHTWPTINDLPAVAIPIEDSLRYQLNSTADLEWEALFPNDGLIYFGSQRKPYTISMFHQLRCLDMLRRYIMHLDWPQSDSGLTPAPEEKHDLAQHCLRYLRQMVVCRADTGLEGLAGRYGATRDGVARCKDWRVVYDMIRHNSME